MGMTTTRINRVQLLSAFVKLALFLLAGCAPETRLPDAPPRSPAAPGSDSPQCIDTMLFPTSGVYVVTPLDKPLRDSVLGLPSLDGIAIRVSWNALQPTAQPPNFALIDEQLVQARRFNKKVSLSIEAGIYTPAWVYALGARPYSYVLDESTGDRMCSRVQMPIPWDPVYLDAFKQLIRAASQRFNRSSILSHVKITGMNSSGQATSLPHSAIRQLTNGQKTCATIDEISAWASVGYSRQRILLTYRDLIDTFEQNFSSHRLAAILDVQGFPPLDQRGQLMASTDYDTEVVPELLQAALFGRASRMLVQSNDLTNTSAYPFPIRLADEIVIGYQLRWPVSGDKAYRMNGGVRESPVAVFDATVRRSVAARGKYLEVHYQDAEDAELAFSFAGARILLRKGTR